MSRGRGGEQVKARVRTPGSLSQPCPCGDLGQVPVPQPAHRRKGAPGHASPLAVSPDRAWLSPEPQRWGRSPPAGTGEASGREDRVWALM